MINAKDIEKELPSDKVIGIKLPIAYWSNLMNACYEGLNAYELREKRATLSNDP